MIPRIVDSTFSNWAVSVKKIKKAVFVIIYHNVTISETYDKAVSCRPTWRRTIRPSQLPLRVCMRVGGRPQRGALNHIRSSPDAYEICADSFEGIVVS